MTDYGYANGWKETPEKVGTCDHQLERKREGNCLHRYTCRECGYTYLVDSSD